jgi:hypothetical protein
MWQGRKTSGVFNANCREVSCSIAARDGSFDWVAIRQYDANLGSMANEVARSHDDTRFPMNTTGRDAVPRINGNNCLAGLIGERGGVIRKRFPDFVDRTHYSAPDA